MNRSDLVIKLAEKSNLGLAQAEEVVDAMVDELRKALTEGRRIEIRGFGSFVVKDYEPHIGRNPKTGEQINVAAKRVPAFKVGKELRERLNEGISGDEDFAE